MKYMFLAISMLWSVIVLLDMFNGDDFKGSLCVSMTAYCIYEVEGILERLNRGK